MNQTLKHPTLPKSHDDDTPLVSLDVFHQLHCLNAIRRIVYRADPYFDPDNVQDQIHLGVFHILNAWPVLIYLQITALITYDRYILISLPHGYH